VRNYEAEMHQMMLERMQMLEEAYERAKAGVATEDDWDIIRSECGLPRRPFVIMESVSITRSEE
jgi:hypothetical protein